MLNANQVTPNDFLGRLNNWKVISEEDVKEGDIIYVSGFKARPLIKKYRGVISEGAIVGVASHKVPKGQVGEMVFESIIKTEIGLVCKDDVVIVDSTGKLSLLKEIINSDNKPQNYLAVGVALDSNTIFLCPGRVLLHGTNVADYSRDCVTTSGSTNLIIPGLNNCQKVISRKLAVFKLECKLIAREKETASITIKLNGAELISIDLSDLEVNDVIVAPGLKTFTASAGDILTTEVTGDIEFYLYAYPTVD